MRRTSYSPTTSSEGADAKTLDEYDVEPYDPGHAPVIGWRPTPGIVFVAR